MAIDFKSLSMTELRTRPGEILDRVADGGESFVVERNGRQKACLVPLSVYLPDISPARIAEELDELAKAGELPNTTVNPDREIAFKFRHSADLGSYVITVVLPHGYPNACPRVYSDNVKAEAPHRFSDGAMCIFGVMTAWNPGKHTAWVALDYAHRWLKHYEVWTTSGKWPSSSEANNGW